MNYKKLYRLYNEEKDAGGEGAVNEREEQGDPLPVALFPGEPWSLDYLSDKYGTSRKFHIMAVYDESRCNNLYLIADTNISGARVAR